jgi:hypothetical protein
MVLRLKTWESKSPPGPLTARLSVTQTLFAFGLEAA